MAKTRGGLSASPSSPMPRPQQSAIGGASSLPAQDPTIPPSKGGTPSQRRYPTRRPPTDPVPPVNQSKRPASRPPAKRTKFSGSGEPSQASQAEPPTEESQIPVGIPLETIIRCPMIAGPPMEGNLDCRDRSFHSETYFDIEGAIGARHIVEALRIPYEPVTRADFKEWSSFSQTDMGAPTVPAPHGPPLMPPPPEIPQDEQLPQAQQDEILTNTTPSAPTAHTSMHIPEDIHPTSPITQGAPPVILATPAPPPSSKPNVTVSLTEFRGLIQQHLSMQTPLGHDRSGPSEPLVPDEETIPIEQPISADEIRAEPSHDPTTI
ncbi:verprolin [Vitis vinifera]|uniref:verprolin n=1 Tax=Vitis vinifera TaxID=29760 RepID=UPI0028833670|nr:verprolin [Vitis vinifera]